MRNERGDLLCKCPQLVQLATDKWSAYGRFAIMIDLGLTVGVVVLTCASIALSPAAQGSAVPPDCLRLHGDASFDSLGLD